MKKEHPSPFISPQEVEEFHRALAAPAEHDFMIVADPASVKPPGVYIWTLVGARLRCIRGSSSVIYIGKTEGDKKRPFCHPGSDVNAVNHYAIAFWCSWWLRKRQLEVWFQKVPMPNIKETEDKFLLTYFRFHYQLPILNRQATCGWNIRQRLGNAVLSEARVYLDSDLPEFPFGLEFMQDTKHSRC